MESSLKHMMNLKSDFLQKNTINKSNISTSSLSSLNIINNNFLNFQQIEKKNKTNHHTNSKKKIQMMPNLNDNSNKLHIKKLFCKINKKKTSKSINTSNEGNTNQIEYLRTEPTPSSPDTVLNNPIEKKFALLEQMKLFRPPKTSKSTYSDKCISLEQLLSLSYSKIDSSFEQIFTEKIPMSKTSNQPCGIVKSFSANTFVGMSKSVNEDRISIAYDIPRPKDFEGYWPKWSIFAIFDGHYGSSCAEYLKENLINCIIKSQYFPSNPQRSLEYGIKTVEENFFQTILNNNSENIDESGSCAIVCLIVDQMIYIANVGDSRAILSYVDKDKYAKLSLEHMPNNPEEKKRIEENGGKILQEKVPLRKFVSQANINFAMENDLILLTPYKVIPGNMTISRSIGDITIKHKLFGGIPNIIVSTPTIHSYKINGTEHCLILGSDGLFERMSEEDVINIVNNSNDISESSGNLIKNALIRNTIDNTSCIIIFFNE